MVKQLEYLDQNLDLGLGESLSVFFADQHPLTNVLSIFIEYFLDDVGQETIDILGYDLCFEVEGQKFL
jgi:hypothetical protein